VDDAGIETFMKNLIRILLTFFVAASTFAEPITIKFSHVTSENSPKGKGAILFQKLVEERLAGRLRLEVYHNASLYSDGDELQALINNDVQFLAPSLSKFGSYTDQFAIFDLPFMFKDVKALQKFWRRQAGTDLLNAVSNRDIVGLAFWSNGMKQMISLQPIEVPGDARGVSFRIQNSETIKKQFETLGANPIPMAFSKSFQALKDGTVSATENTWSNFYGQNYHTVQEYVTETNHGVLAYMLVTNRTFWSSLPFDVKVELTNIIDEVTAYVNKEANEINMQARTAILASNEVKLLMLDEAKRAQWQAAFEPFYDLVLGNIDASILRTARNVNR
jgi:C4-dicarboxylate-binding protein DctP